MSQPTSGSYTTSLKRRLLGVLVAGLLLPLFTSVALVSVYFLYSLDLISVDLFRARERILFDSVGVRLQSHAQNLSSRVDSFFIERLIDIKTLAANPLLVEASAQGRTEHARRGLSAMSVAEVESHIDRVSGSNGTLSLFPKSDSYLRQYQLANVFFLHLSVTDQDGYTVASSTPVHDFVRRDEAWWRDAWTSGLHVGSPGYTRTTSTPSMQLAVRIDHVDTGQPIGVLHAVLGMRRIQSLLDRSVASVPGMSVVLFSDSGELVTHTTTAGQRHYTAADLRSASHLVGTTVGHFELEGDLVGFAQTGRVLTYATVAPKFDGLGWTVQAILPSSDLFVDSSFMPLQSSFDRLSQWPWVVVGAFSLVSLSVFIVVLLLVLWTLRSFRDFVQGVARSCDRTPPGGLVRVMLPTSFFDLDPLIHRLRGLDLDGGIPPSPVPPRWEDE